MRAVVYSSKDFESVAVSRFFEYCRFRKTVLHRTIQNC